MGAIPCDTPADAVTGAARVHLVLKDDASVDAVLDAAHPALAPDTLILDHTTTAPAGTAARVARLDAAGVPYLHCPVFMSPAAARAAQGIILASGDRARYDRAQPALAAMTGRVEYMGDRPDLAAVYKLLGNAMILAMAGGFADVLAIGRANGVEPTAAQALFTIFNPTGMIAGVRGSAMARGDWTASFELAMARKDAQLMLDAAGSQPLGVLPGLAARMDALIARGLGEHDTGVLAIDAVTPGH
jgi:3-hydroxyisobutyrate dehydrogenase-like beta-hydroxyacid dehydrogenase